MREDEVYVATKNWFIANKFIALAGQPPNGCDNIPTIEIKKNTNVSKGSFGSFKPDLIFANQNYFILVECKPRDDLKDEQKLLEVDADISRKKLLYFEITQRGILVRRKLDLFFPTFEIFEKKLRYCLAHSEDSRLMSKLSTLSLRDLSGNGILTPAILSDYKIEF